MQATLEAKQLPDCGCDAPPRVVSLPVNAANGRISNEVRTRTANRHTRVGKTTLNTFFTNGHRRRNAPAVSDGTAINIPFRRYRRRAVGRLDSLGGVDGTRCGDGLSGCGASRSA